MKARRSRLMKQAGKVGCDALVAFEPENLFYMTGFWGEAIGVLEADRTTVIAPELEADRVRSEATDVTVIPSARHTGMIKTLAGLVRGKKACTDCQSYPVMMAVKKAAPAVRYEPGPFESARLVKDDGEIAILRKASGIIDDMFGVCAEKIRVGKTESELQTELMSYALGRGMSDTGYRSTLNPLIIAGGPNGALPHAQVTNRRFWRGDLIVVDITLRYKGYVSDATRTFALGFAPAPLRRAYDVVYESQKLGLKAVRQGVSCGMVDAACREYIEESGYGEYFVHSTGHGIGLEVHEQPAVTRDGIVKLSKGMAITVEPGVYIPKKFGIRIEDSLIVGSKPMHQFTKELLRV